MSPFQYLPEGTRVSFRLQNALPLFREHYAASGAGEVILKGLFNQSAHLELLDGTRYRTLPPRKDERYAQQIAYPVVLLPGKTQVCRLLTPIDLEQGRTPQLRYTTVLDDQQYVFRQVSPGRRGFELWDGMEMQKLVRREKSMSLIADLTVLLPVPTLLVLLFPWLDNQTIVSRQ
jgi:hypothetical protein